MSIVGNFILPWEALGSKLMWFFKICEKKLEKNLLKQNMEKKE